MSSQIQEQMMSSWFEQVEKLKQEVRKMLTFSVDKPQENLNLIDNIQRLGLAYHFKREIEEALQMIYDQQKDNGSDEDVELYTVAVRFRLLREQGYNISSDTFNKFKDDKGNFKKELVNHVRGLLSLYEASHLSLHGEDVLDQALAFTRTQLQSMEDQLSPPLGQQVSQTLMRPLRKSVLKQEAWQFISMYQQNELQVEALMKLAKLEFNMVQNLQQKELADLTKWLDVTKLPFAQEKMIRCYFWSLGVFQDPQHDLCRILLAKALAIFSVVDTTYHFCGNLDDVELFTEAIERFNVNIKDKLPENMKVCYQAVLDFYVEIEEVMARQGRSFCMIYVKEEIKKVAQAYLTEARWVQGGYVPTIEECLQIGWITTVYSLLILVSFLGMGEIASKDALDWLMTEPKSAKACSVICRIMADILFHKFKQDRGNAASVVKSYINRHGLSEEEAYMELDKLVADAWKDINEELLYKPTDAPMPLLTCILNFARVSDVVYYNASPKPPLKDILQALLLNPMEI